MGKSNVNFGSINNDVPKEKTSKKKFFCKMKYNNKHKVKEWEEKRQKYIIKKYNKELKRQNIDASKSNVNHRFLTQNDNKRVNALSRAKAEFERKKAEKIKLRDEKLKKKAEIEEALTNYKRRKADKFRKLSKRTKKGQPVMKERLELLYEEIKQKFGSQET